MKKRNLFLFFCCFFFLFNHSQNTSTTPVERIKNKTSILTPKFQQTRDHQNPNFQFFKIGLFCCFSAFLCVFLNHQQIYINNLPSSKNQYNLQPSNRRIDINLQVSKEQKKNSNLANLCMVPTKPSLSFYFFFLFFFNV